MTTEYTFTFQSGNRYILKSINGIETPQTQSDGNLIYIIEIVRDDISASPSQAYRHKALLTIRSLNKYSQSVILKTIESYHNNNQNNRDKLPAIVKISINNNSKQVTSSYDDTYPMGPNAGLSADPSHKLLLLKGCKTQTKTKKYVPTSRTVFKSINGVIRQRKVWLDNRQKKQSANNKSMFE